MTAREFIQDYIEVFEVPGDKLLQLLDCYLTWTANVRYSEFPDADLPKEFLEDADEPANFEEWIEMKLNK
jgi:hypothetical protein